ncbi:ATP-binding protein, partial [Actinacidiphila rubida]
GRHRDGDAEAAAPAVPAPVVPEPVAAPAEPHVESAPRKPCTATLVRARDTVVDAARAGGDGVRFAVVADSGCGKTLLLEEIANELKADRRLVLFVTAGAPQYGEGRTVEPAEREMADYAACRQIVDAIAADVHRAYVPEGGEEPLLTAGHGRELETAILATREVRRPEPGAGTHVTIDVSRSHDVRIGDIGGIGDAVSGALTPPVSRLVEMQRQLTRILDGEARTRPTALLVDDVHTVAGTQVEEWLMALLRGLSTAVVVHGGRPAAGGGSLPGVRQIRLGLLSRDETTAFVRQRLVEAGWQYAAATAAAREVAVLTRGHPIGMATCSGIVRDSMPVDSPVAAVRALLLGGGEHWDDGDAFEAVRTYVDGRAARVTGRPVALFDLLVILRRCTPEVFGAVLAEAEDVTERHASQLYDWLSDCAFVSPFDDDADEGWRLHDYLRENLDRRFRRTRPTEHARLHAVVERHYRARMNFDEERDEQSAYALGARYEDPEWQRDSQEWLHHAAHLSREEFDGAKRAMIRLFFEAFYWWDVEVAFSYCDQLVAAYRALPADRDLRWVAWLEQLRTAYVPGRIHQVPGRDRERWELAAEALDEIADYLRLRRGRVPTDPDLRRVYIVFCQLQAAVVWFGSDGTPADRARASEWFQASAAACSDESELWMGNWAASEEASLWVTEDPARARALLDGLEERVADEEDHELPVWLAATFSDIAWAEGDPRRSFDALGRAALHGAVYHVRQETFGQYPNLYSDSLYRNILTRVARREQEALEAGFAAEVAAAKARCRALFAPYWLHIGQDPGDGFGLPHPPAETDLRTDLTDFARTAKWMIRNMGDELEKSLEEPLRTPPPAP